MEHNLYPGGIPIRAVIVCNGSVNDYTYISKYFKDADLVICADGGAAHIRRFGIKPDILLGDFDSITEADFNLIKHSGTEIISFPSNKDMTDTELAVDLALEKGCKSVVIVGGVGTRLDHSMANIFLLKKMLDRGVNGTIVNEYNEIVLIKDSIKLKKEQDIKVTLLPLSERVEGVSTKGLSYPLSEARMELGSSWGVSNEFASDTAEISIKSGLLLVIKSRD